MSIIRDRPKPASGGGIERCEWFLIVYTSCGGGRRHLFTLRNKCETILQLIQNVKSDVSRARSPGAGEGGFDCSVDDSGGF